MYAVHYNLKELPFEEAFDPKFIWLGEKSSAALTEFKTVIQERKGYYFLTGDAGTGKTYLAKRFLCDIESDKIVATIPHPGLDKYSFFNYLSEEFKIERRFMDRGLFLLHIRNFLIDAEKRKISVILVVDEAQRISPELLEEIILLSNIKTGNRKLIHIMFIGQPALEEMMTQNGNRDFARKIAVTYRLEPLTEAETTALIHHRLKAAGATSQIFSPEALHAIYRFSSGYPRLVMTICYRALLTGFVRDVRYIQQDIISECAREVDIGEMVHKPTGPAATGPGRRPGAAEAESIVYSGKISDTKKGYAAVDQSARSRKVWAAALLAVLFFCAGYIVSILKPDFISRWHPGRIKPEQSRVATGDRPATAESTTPNVPAGDRTFGADERRQPDVSETNVPERGNGNVAGGVYDSRDDVPATHTPGSGRDEGSTERPAPGNMTVALQTAPNALPVQPNTENAVDSEAAKPDEMQMGSRFFDDSSPVTARGDRTASPQQQTSEPEAPVPMPSTTPAPGPRQGGAIPAASSEGVQNLPSPQAPETARSTRAERPDPGRMPSPKDIAGAAAAPAAAAAPTGTRLPPEAVATGRLYPDPAETTAEKNRTRQAPPETASTRIFAAGPELESSAGGRAAALSDIVRLEPEIADRGIQPRMTMMERLKSFLKAYCESYSAGDLAGFTAFFTPDAAENGKPFAARLPEYQQVFAASETISYRIDIQDYSVDTERRTVRIEGRFDLKWLPRGAAWQQKSGSLVMELKEKDRSFRVYRLDH